MVASSSGNSSSGRTRIGSLNANSSRALAPLLRIADSAIGSLSGLHAGAIHAISRENAVIIRGLASYAQARVARLVTTPGFRMLEVIIAVSASSKGGTERRRATTSSTAVRVCLIVAESVASY